MLNPEQSVLVWNITGLRMSSLLRFPLATPFSLIAIVVLWDISK